MFVFTAPDWQGSAPISITRERPINVICKPIAISTGLNSLWEPVGLLILP